MSIHRSNKKKKNTRVSATKRRRLFLYSTFLAIFITSAWWFIGSYYVTNHPQAATDSGALEHGDPNAYKNLDLSEAAKSTYINSSISRVKELGIARGVDHAIISFNIPKEGFTENGLMTLPATPRPANGYPVVVLCHGYTNPWDYSTTTAYLTDMEYYSKNGYAVVKPDFRGQGLSLSSGTPDGAYYSMSYNTDVLSLIAAIKATDYLDKRNISIWGHSMGGYIALRAAVLEPDIKNVILISAPVGTIQDMYSSYVAISDTQNPTSARIKQEQLDIHGTPLSNPGYWDKASPLNYLSKTNAHIQIHVGTLDGIVPPHFSQDLNTALENLQKPHSYYVYRGGKHGLVPERSLIWSRSLQLLNQSLEN